jgi:phage terminase large subunit
MRTLHLPAPNERQRLFLKDEHRYVAFGGARGGGKSWAVRVKAILLCLRYPGIKVMIVRRTYPELRANHILPLQEMLGDLAKYKDVVKEFHFQNGSMILLRSAQNEPALEKYQGTEADVLFIDEATQFTEEQYKRFTACVRGVNSFPKRVYLTCNPGGVGHQWVKRRFIDRAFNLGENPDDYNFIRSLVTDNKALMKSDPDYIKQLEALPPKLRKAWLEGNWDIFEGQFFEDFCPTVNAMAAAEAGLTPEEAQALRRYTHVIEPFEVPRSWQIYRSFDWGYAKPYSCDWWAVDHDGVAYLILQDYGCTENANEGVKRPPQTVFKQIAETERGHRWLRGKQIIGIADPSIWDASRGESIAEIANRYGVYFDKGDNERQPGWMQCHYRLQMDEEGRSLVYFFDTCKAAIRTLPLLQYDEHVPEDLDTSGEDHFADSMRYFFMARPVAPRIPEEPGAKVFAPLDIAFN